MKAGRDRWQGTSVAEVMTPASRLVIARADDDASEVLETLARASVNQVPVLDGDALVGLLSREDLLTWLALHSPAAAGVQR